jgi:hypothetical protein
LGLEKSFILVNPNAIKLDVSAIPHAPITLGTPRAISLLSELVQVFELLAYPTPNLAILF